MRYEKWGIDWATFNKGAKKRSKVWLLKAVTPKLKPNKNEIGTATKTKDKVSMAGVHWPKTAM